MQISDILSVVKADFSAVDRLIHEQLASRVPLVEKIADYIVSSGGKRIRPLLVILTSKALQRSDEPALKLAAVIEFLHTATLLHDDVVDTSDMRRGNPTANAKWGNAPSVLVGDFLYSRAFQMMVELESLPVMKILSDATCVIAEGEVLQLTNVKNPDISEQQYRDVIHGKTAMLFEASTHAAAVLAQASLPQQQALQRYGTELGMAFQLIDDLLDYSGDAQELGKNVGDDLAEGKPTLPLIHAMATGSEEQRQVIRQAIRRGGLDQLEDIVRIVQDCGSLDYTRVQAQACADNAKQQLELLPPSEAKEALAALADIAVMRTH
ncbi:octaprenyl diphosphate synthase [Bacterioplanes sanyensis]|uniref:Octaprenyl diphosphate synthase n=1 Tax=Bacterioplanes sanyensis TaxID=1249553 RepID=A0A222FJZ7_9GAMM|nr:octaprenyl diphosphate synthase [Bacterioplanes sanyensis]ASP38906.1 octaprenyl diphosphate synthase [Bacterioplanes sanyensis]